MGSNELKKLWEYIQVNGLRFLLNIVTAVVVYYIGNKVISVFMKWFKKYLFKAKKLDETVQKFLYSLVNIALKVFLIVSVISIMGVPTTSFVAVVGALSLAIGLAFQGSLSNFAGGLLLLVLRPIKVGDYIDVSGFQGTVEAINIFTTDLVTIDNKKVIMPNAQVSNATIVNFSANDKRRVDMTFGVSYDSDIDHVKRVLREVIDAIPQTLQAPEPFVALSEQADSALVFVVRVWANKSDYWAIHFALLENVKKAFDKEGIDIPYNVLDVRLPEKNQ